MVKQRHLKQLVRDRAAKTGESYVTARQRVTARKQNGAAAGGAVERFILPETASLALVLEGLGVTAPHTGAAPSEALLFGVCGGIGFGYWIFEYKEVPFPLLSVFTRHAWDSAKRFTTGGLERLGITHTDKETSSGPAAEKALLDALAAGRRPLVWVSAALAADSDLPAQLAAAAPHVMVAESLDAGGETVSLLDRSRTPLAVARAALAASRALVKSEKNRLRLIDPPQALDAQRLRLAVREAIAACVRELTGPPPLPAMAAPNSGLAGLEKLARQLSDAKDKRGWPKLFPPGPKLQKGLSGLDRSADGLGTGALRGLYADFLEEAAALLDRPALREVAATYRQLAEAWRALARAAAAEAPQDEPASHRLLQELGQRVSAILEQERAAVAALEGALR
ncbi:MAG TPA: DUF4872 domain-containing protein [Chloroflexota bacterium]|nr:DUF4872 domain-containing protein [Chloroflexota bacterium]